MTTRTWLSQGSRKYRTANHFFSFAQWDMTWICFVTFCHLTPQTLFEYWAEPDFVTVSLKKMMMRTWLSQGSRKYRTANHFFSFAQWDISWICSVTWVKEDVNASPILSFNTANAFWVLSATWLWNSEMKENDDTYLKSLGQVTLLHNNFKLELCAKVHGGFHLTFWSSLLSTSSILEYGF